MRMSESAIPRLAISIGGVPIRLNDTFPCKRLTNSTALRGNPIPEQVIQQFCQIRDKGACAGGLTS
jgi:hypothetical protein